MIWWFQVRSFILTLQPSNRDFVDAGGVSEKLCGILDDFSKEKFLIDLRRADCQDFFGFYTKLQAIFAPVHLWQLKPDQLKKSYFEANPTNVAILPFVQSEIRKENTQEANQLLP